MTMISEDGDISALLSEPNLDEEQAVTSGSDDFLPAILESIKSNEKEVELSPEEAAWADSCFVQTSELSDEDWGALKQALLDSLQEPIEGSRDTTEVMLDQGTHALSEAESHSLHVEKDAQDDNVEMEQQGNSDDDKDATEVGDVTNVIRGADEHGRQMDGYTADELVSSEVIEQAESRDSIFKVWDLDVSFSEDESELELIKDLKKLLKCKPQDATYPPPGDAAKALSEINVDELVASLSNLSLQRNQ
ncbi:hypothetical protein CFC21_087122 [Triticum aestivum]|uniref:Uncharacterized protein n=3 Tax=Triticum TaxID=4564 RepID=A0A9R0YG55_TRITD|nr:uncharacterized protein LOC123136112 [Triticum aestivum]KAF7083315.1 hypothetical protein CFC21_087122 [Triticum aestivum]VAI54790.1 unnamed protein product [Triticum turgidum subsp. durum]